MQIAQGCAQVQDYVEVRLVRESGRLLKRRSTRFAAALSAVALLGLAGCGGSSSNSSSSSSSSSSGSTGSTSSTGTLATDYALPGANLYNTRYVGGPINASNVGSLKQAWTCRSRPRARSACMRRHRSSWAAWSTSRISSRTFCDRPGHRQAQLVQKLQHACVGPNGVTVDNGMVYGDTAIQTFALQAAPASSCGSRSSRATAMKASTWRRATITARLHLNRAR